MVAKDEQIGFHKGALSTLVKEREELVKMVQVVEQIMQAHIKALEDLGVKLQEEKPKKSKKNLDDAL